jgi:hypothetical protein
VLGSALWLGLFVQARPLRRRAVVAFRALWRCLTLPASLRRSRRDSPRRGLLPPARFRCHGIRRRGSKLPDASC